MAIKLLSDSLSKITHIALTLIVALTLQIATAQTVLLPGDITVVSVEADSSDSSFDFIPLIDISEGTSVYFSNGRWVSNDHVLQGSELRVDFVADVEAGTDIHIRNGFSDFPNIKVFGGMDFKGEAHRLLAYQKEESKYRFLYGVGWGHPDVWNSESEFGSDIPVSISTENFTFLSLGNLQKYRYYIRNGASGTRSMLLKFVGDAANWRGFKSRDLYSFGTSFKLLAPPVVLFDESISVAEESTKSIQLKVAIYEHDGSKLTVDVEYDSLLSTADKFDIARFKQATLNFTGLIGDGVYEIKVPLRDDNEYEGRETAFFEMKNLSKGNFGDFLTHSLILNDNEYPDIDILSVSNINQASAGFVSIRNNENIPVPLAGWVLGDSKKGFTFGEDAIIEAGETIRVFNKNPGEDFIVQGEHNFFASGEELKFSDKGGQLRLSNDKGTEITRFAYNDLKEVTDRNTDGFVYADQPGVNQHEIDQPNPAADQQEESSTQQILKPGWRVFSTTSGLLSTFSGNTFYYWNEKEQTFENADEADPGELNAGVLFAYFEEELIDKLSTWVAESSKAKTASPASLLVHLSATDRDDNGVINGYEGLNLVRNTLNKTVSVYSVTEEIRKKKTGLVLDPVIYTIQKSLSGQIEYIALAGNDLISPNTSFLIKLESPANDLSFVIEQAELDAEPRSEGEPGADKEAKIGLRLSTGALNKNLNIQFSSPDIGPEVYDLSSYSKLRFPSQSFLAFAVGQGPDFYNKLNFPFELESNLSLPVSFETSASGTFNLKTTAWENIPEEWTVVLVDKKTNEELELDNDFSYEFDYFNESVSVEEGNELPAEDNYSRQERFELKIVLPQEETEEPTETELHQNYPNPFNPVTTISFFLPEPTEVKLSVFNIVGQPVAVLIDEGLSAGDHQVDWDASEHPSGMYIYQLEVGNKIMTRKMTLVK